MHSHGLLLVHYLTLASSLQIATNPCVVTTILQAAIQSRQGPRIRHNDRKGMPLQAQMLIADSAGNPLEQVIQQTTSRGDPEPVEQQMARSFSVATPGGRAKAH
mmetsp:Transcript_19929/g.60469  ORF Transcript_19929/g.60469 Transcript_19929/m.60469 type:complete len:104 (+) Transcript_19929:296-607(+)|eukprot:scaffold107485_cov33-Tisochrysis_lutea.AAC.4